MDAKEALKKFGEAKDYWSTIYDAARSDIRFSIGLDHYYDKTEEQCRKEGLMIVPVLPQFIHQVANDMRQNTPSINVIPGDGEGNDAETAKIFKGLIRNIEYKSGADEVYDTAGEYSVRGGLGFARVDHDYVGSDSFEQELLLRRVQNPLSVYLDPKYTECDGSDAEWGFILDKMNKADFEENYPGKKFSSFEDKPTDDKTAEITIAEFFIKEYSESTKQISSSGVMEDYVDDKKSKKKKTRKVRKVTIKRYKFSGVETLEETTFPGEYIPIVPFHGEEVWVDNKRYLMSLIRLAKDAQRRVNKWASKESQILDMAPISPVMAPMGAVDDFMNEWGQPGDVNVMRYRTKDAAGNDLPKPERLPPPPIPTGIINAMQGAKENVKEALGMYNASIGQKSNAISGVAYDAQKTEADVATFHFADNSRRSIEHIGRILVCAIPEIYDTPRIIRIIGDEEEPQMVGINGAAAQQGQEQHYDLTKGKYDVRVITGASYTTKRQEAAALMGDMLSKQPQLMQIIGDLYFKNLDVAGADAIAARLKKTIPKELTADEDAKNNGEQAQDPEKIQMAQIIQQQQQELQQVTAELQTKQVQDQASLIKANADMTKANAAMLKAKAEAIQSVSQPAPNEPSQTSNAPSPTPDMDENQIMGMLQDKQMANQRAQDQAQNQAQVEAQREAFEAQQEQMEMQQRADQANAVIQTLGVIAQQLGNLNAQVAQPKQVMRDANGAIVGVQ